MPCSLECRVVVTSMVTKYGLFVLEVVHAWIDPAVKNPRTLPHRGYGSFMVAGRNDQPEVKDEEACTITAFPLGFPPPSATLSGE